MHVQETSSRPPYLSVGAQMTEFTRPGGAQVVTTFADVTEDSVRKSIGTNNLKTRKAMMRLTPTALVLCIMHLTNLVDTVLFTTCAASP